MTPARIVEMASAYYDSCVLFTASDLGVFEWLARHGPADAERLATALGLHPGKAAPFLDACVALELLAKDAGSYRNTPEASAFLVPGNPADLSGAIRYNRDVYPAWGKLRDMVLNGRPVESPGTHLGDDPERTRAFVMAMHGRAMAIGRAVLPMMALGDHDRILDPGGGSGAFSILATQARPGIHGVVMDLPAVIEIAAELVAEAGVSDRIRCVPGDYRTDAFPDGNDGVILFGMLHQESPSTIQTILNKAYAALRPGGSVYVMDMMTDASRCRPKFSALFALNMALTADHGWVFSDDDLRGWCDAAGFVDFICRPTPPPMPHWLAQARKLPTP